MQTTPRSLILNLIPGARVRGNATLGARVLLAACAAIIARATPRT